MQLYRIAEAQFAAELSGEGAKRAGGRWNPPGIPMVYTSDSVALAALEVLIRLATPKRYTRVIFVIPDNAGIETVTIDKLPANWYLPYPNVHLIEFGKTWTLEKRSLALKVPSAVVRGEGWNYLINPLHDEFNSVTILDVAPFEYDMRLTGGK